jgi:hypothetical protein
MLVKKVCLHCPQIFSVQLADMIFSGCCRPQASRAQPQGQGLQVPPHSHRVPYPPSGSLLQDRRCPSPHLEVRVLDRLHHGRISGF